MHGQHTGAAAAHGKHRLSIAQGQALLEASQTVTRWFSWVWPREAAPMIPILQMRKLRLNPSFSALTIGVSKEDMEFTLTHLLNVPQLPSPPLFSYFTQFLSILQSLESWPSITPPPQGW